MTKLFPTILVVLDICAAVMYAYHGGWAAWRQVGYWAAAAFLTFCVMEMR